jgi:hypothetical protein
MAVETIYTGIDHESLTSAKSKINEFSTKLASTENKILADLDGLKKQITVDNKTKDNGIDEITQNFKTFKNSYNDTLALFKNLEEKYDESVIRAAKHMEAKFEEVEK